ncbi:MAG: hypothetical protein ACM3S0_05890, partial [Acidobacteriota bacterium]
LGRERQNTTRDYYFNDPFLWNFLIGKINLDFAKKLAGDPEYLNKHTVIIEFARGGENGFTEAFSHLSNEILNHAVIMYIDVPFAESVRRNRRRARPGMESSILYHSLSDEKMERLYRSNDWARLSGDQPEGIINIKGHEVPFAVFENEPEKTDDPAKLGPALVQVLDKLWRAMGHRG